MDHHRAGGNQRPVLHANESLKVNAANVCTSHKSKRSQPHVPSSAMSCTQSSAKRENPCCVVRPRVKSLASWTPLLAIDSLEDMPPTRKLSLGRFFNNTKDDEEFMLVLPQQVNVNRTTVTRSSHGLVHRYCQDGASCDAPMTTSSSSTRRPFALSIRQSARTNPFTLKYESNPTAQHHDQDLMVNSSTPPPSRSLAAFLSPFNDENARPIESFDIPERLMLPSV